jgi:hypothetical protein
MICLLNFLRYRQGVSEVFQGYEDANQSMEQGGMNNGYDNFGAGSASMNDTSSYKQAPFNNNNPNMGYQQSNY